MIEVGSVIVKCPRCGKVIDREKAARFCYGDTSKPGHVDTAFLCQSCAAVVFKEIRFQIFGSDLNDS